jgi:hypothetical protein
MRRVVFLIAFAVACGDDPDSLSGSRTSGQSGTGSGDDTSDSGVVDPSAPPGTPPPPAGPATAAKICVDTINAYRKQAGLPAYTEWTEIETCSDGEAKSDGNSNTPHGAFPKCGENAQNECPGWQGPPETMIKQCLGSMWAQGAGEGHHDNMASKQWTKVACGFYTLPGGGVWSVQNFR